jgi:hypothetical protein
MPLPSLRRLACAAAFLCLPLLAAADESPVVAADAAAIRHVIEDQMRAFRRDDGEAAFAFATPALRRQFGSADRFMHMVRSGYRPVYRPHDVTFGTLEAISGTPVQHVLVVGPDGGVVEALYFMERQADGSWRIGGCMLSYAQEKTS